MTAISRRVHRLEERLRPAVAEGWLTVQCGNLKTLPADYAGPRHVVTVRQPEPGTQGLFEWEERPGADPKSVGSGENDQHVLRVCYVEAKDDKPAQ